MELRIFTEPQQGAPHMAEPPAVNWLALAP